MATFYISKQGVGANTCRAAGKLRWWFKTEFQGTVTVLIPSGKFRRVMFHGTGPELIDWMLQNFDDIETPFIRLNHADGRRTHMRFARLFY